MSKEIFLQAYKNVFKDYEKTELETLVKRGLLFQYDTEISKPNVLFVGINPSFDKKIATISDTYKKDQVEKIQYFKAFHNVENKLKSIYDRDITWTHLDLCVFRETAQSIISDEILKYQFGADFIMKQLAISNKILHQIQPQLIVVSNTLARKFLGFESKKNKDLWLAYKFEFDYEIGTYRIKTPGLLFDTPIFFTSMLSGQRALDVGSQERLVWHINEVLKK